MKNRRLTEARRQPGTDFFSPAERSRLMSRIRGRANISTELCVARVLRSNSISGWRRHLRLPGRPDFTFTNEKVCIFVHGCFWHGCPRCQKQSNTRPEYWAEKIKSNRRRDARVTRELRQLGYRVVVVWECTLRRKHPKAAINRLLRLLEKHGVCRTLLRDPGGTDR